MNVKFDAPLSPSSLNFCGEQAKLLFKLRADGTIELGELATLDDAAREFWRIVNQSNPWLQPVAQARSLAIDDAVKVVMVEIENAQSTYRQCMTELGSAEWRCRLDGLHMVITRLEALKEAK